MIKLKSSLTCSYCSKIYKNPIELPCSHTLCKEHLAEKNVNKIKCAECKQDKPYPGDYITSFKKMVIVSQCKECRINVQKGYREKYKVKGTDLKFNAKY